MSTMTFSKQTILDYIDTNLDKPQLGGSNEGEHLPMELSELHRLARILPDELSLTRADSFCCNVLKVHPGQVYGADYWTAEDTLPDMDDLEERLDAGEFATKQEFYDATGAATTAGRRAVRKALFPEARAALMGLPAGGSAQSRVPDEFIQTLAGLRAKGLTQKQIGDEVGLSRSQVSELLSRAA